LKKYYKILVIPAMIIIVAGFFSGFGSQSSSVEDLLRERTTVMQNAYYGKIDMEKAETRLKEIETYPLISEDIQSIRDLKSTEVDMVRSMDFLSVKKTSKLFDYISYEVEIQWDMKGLNENYISTNKYTVIMKSQDDKVKISEFNLK